MTLASRYAHWLARWRVVVVVATLALVGVASSGIRFLEFDTDFRMFFSEQNPQLTVFEHLEKTYAKDDNVLFVLAPKDGQVFTPRTLAAVETLTREAWKVPYSNRVDSLTNFQHPWSVGDDLTVDDLVRDAEKLSPEALARVREIALHEPLLVNRLVSPRGHVAGVNVTVQFPQTGKTHAVPEVAAFAKKLAANLRAAHPGLEIHLTGGVMMDNAFGEATERDLKTLVPAMFVLLILALAVLLGGVVGTAVTVLVLSLAILGAMGLAGWLGITLSPSSATAPTIILTCAVADCVHILTTFFKKLRAGTEKAAAMVDALSHNLHSMCLTGATTAIGFLTMNSSEVPVFRDLGNITAIGVVLAFALSVSLLPALMTLLPVRVSRRRHRWSDHTWKSWPDTVVRHRRPIFWFTSAAIVALLACLPLNELNDEFIKYFGRSVDFRRATDFAADNLTGIYQMHYSLPAEGSGGISEPRYLAQVEEFAQWYRQQPEALHVYSVTDVFKLLNRVMHGDEPGWYRLPESREMAAQYLLLYEMSLPAGLDLSDRISVDKGATRITVTLRNLSSKQVLALEERAQEFLTSRSFGPSTGGGLTPMFAHIGQRNITSMLSGTLWGYVWIAVILACAARSLKIGLVSMVPNLIPAAMAFGLWALLVGQVGMVVAVVASVTLGIVVDDTVHFLTKYHHARRGLAQSPSDAVRHAVGSVGQATLVTGIILTVGFGVLAFSSFEINSGMGLLTAIAIVFATATEFLLLPPLILMIEEGL